MHHALWLWMVVVVVHLFLWFSSLVWDKDKSSQELWMHRLAAITASYSFHDYVQNREIHSVEFSYLSLPLSLICFHIISSLSLFFFFLLVTPGCSINVLISFCSTVVVSQNLFFLYLLCRACCASQRESVANWVFSSASKMLFLFAQWPERNVWVWVCISLVRTSALQLSHSHTRTGCRRRFCVAILYPLTEATRKRPHHATFPQHIQHRRRRKSSFRSNCSWCGVGCRWFSLLYNETLPSQRCFFLPFFFLNMVAPN